MNLEQFTGGDERFARRYDYDDRTVVAIDLGSAAADASIDVVDGTVIVVTGDDQLEIDLPSADARAFINNGILTIETEESA